ncbi:MAG TPA: hypothetical protein VEI03_10910 [Stellaceae bacterium]|nr:hypothetical protein [Stellaceae bacterium]
MATKPSESKKGFFEFGFDAIRSIPAIVMVSGGLYLLYEKSTLLAITALTGGGVFLGWLWKIHKQDKEARKGYHDLVYLGAMIFIVGVAWLNWDRTSVLDGHSGDDRVTTVPVVTPKLSKEEQPVPPDRAPSNAFTVSVPAQIPWGANTGIVLTAGDQVSISASGSVYIGAQQNHALDNEGPDGQPWGTCAGSNGRMPFVAPALPCWSLVGRIGVSGVPFEIGARRTFSAPTTGPLFFSVNDNFFPDNSGAWSVIVQVSRTR